MSAITAQLVGARTVLLEEPPIGKRQDVCTSLLTDGDREPHVLFVTYTRRPAECIEQLSGESVRDIGIITVGDGTASYDDDSVTTKSVSTPSDLTGLGINMGKFLSTWDAPIAVSFESLTSLLQYVDFRTAYEFVHAITGQCHAASAHAHFHIDPSAHSEKDVAGLTSLFDATVTVNEDDCTVRTRKLLG